jgi:hypothetical protein
LIETAIVMPLYMLLLLGLIYFGYSTLSRQREAVAGTLASWLPGDQHADVLLQEFWPWAGTPAPEDSHGGSAASAGDTTLWLDERVRDGDEYYGEEIPSQLLSGVHTLAGGGSQIFDTERIAVSLWVYALGEMSQKLKWGDDGGLVPVPVRSWDQISGYLNAEAENSASQGGGFVQAGEGCPPQISPWSQWITIAFDGFSGRWLQRRTTAVEAMYRPPFFGRIYAEEGSQGSTFGQYVSGEYSDPDFQPVAAMQFDLTGRADGVRYAAGETEDATSDALLAQASAFVGDGDTLEYADGMDQASLGIGTIKEHWLSK